MRILVVLLVLASTVTALPTDSGRDIVYFKNGTSIAGRIIDLEPRGNVRIIGDGGVEYTFLMSDVERIVREPDRSVPVAKDPLIGCALGTIMPGAGMLYAGEPGWGLAYFGVGSALGFWTALELLRPWGNSGYYNEPRASLVPVLALFSLKFLEYAHTIKSVGDYNRRQHLTLGRRADPEHAAGRGWNPPALVLATPGSGPGIGIGIPVGW